MVQLTDDDCKALGMKDEDTEVEKFISANTQELGKDKWLCPLSGKKFKGPEFVRKQFLNKHAEKLEEVKKEVLGLKLKFRLTNFDLLTKIIILFSFR